MTLKLGTKMRVIPMDSGDHFIPFDMIYGDGPHEYSAFASDIGLPPGVWPREIRTNFGTGCPLVLLRRDCEEYALYRQSAGCAVVKIFNT